MMRRANIFKLTESTRSNPNNEWSVPEGYFEALNDRMVALARAEASAIAPEESFFLEQQKILQGLATITAIEQSGAQWQVPQDYFEKQSAQLSEIIQEENVLRVQQIRVMKPIWWSSIAASIAVLIAFFWLRSDSSEPANFGQLLAAVELNEEDMEWLADTEDIFEFYAEADTLSMDSLLLDTLTKHTLPPDSTVLPVPAAKSKKLTWDDLTDEEILEYLMESGDADELLD
jgi:hypothetical protein